MAPTIAPLRVKKSNDNGSDSNVTWIVYGHSHTYKVTLDSDTVTPRVSDADAKTVRNWFSRNGYTHLASDKDNDDMMASYAATVMPVSGKSQLPTVGPGGATGIPGTAQAIEGSEAGQAAGDVKQAVSGIGNMLQFLGSAQFWERSGEVVVGLIIVGVGLNAIVKDATGTDVAKKARKAGEAAMFL